MKKGLLALAALFVVFSGCVEESSTKAGKLFSVELKAGQKYRYRFVSDRKVELRLSDDEKKAQKASETLDMVIAYEIVDTDLYGISTVKATCESVKVKRTSFSKRSVRKSDVVEGLAGKSWVFKVNSLGQIQNYDELEKVVTEMGSRAVVKQGKRRIKDPDMIDDFVVTQWFLWDPVASIKKPLKGVEPGQSWKSYLNIPFARRVPGERAVTYTLLESKEGQKPNLAMIKADYELEKLKFDADKKPLPKRELPNPYEGNFQMRGMFGFLTNYQVTDLQGDGEVVFDTQRGILIKNVQEYKVELLAGFLFPLGNSVPEISVDQKITAELIEE